jgi:branched-chain amino acid transport system substrate-binding protein
VVARWLCLATLALVAAAISGCASGGAATNDDAVGSQLAVYSSLPLQGPSAPASEQIVGGEKLALADAGGRAGRFRVGYVSLDASNPASGSWNPGVTATNAKTAAQDTSTIAYLGDYESAATAISLPLINAAGIPQVSPASPYVGLTESLDAGQDEPERFYPSGVRTFARLQPGDPVQAEAQVALMRSLGVRSLYLLDDQDPFSVPLAELVADDAARAGIKVVAHDSLSIVTGGVYTGEAEKVAESGAQAVFYSGEGSEGAAQLWRELHAADSHLQLFAPSSADLEPFTSQLAAAESSTYLTTPVLPAALYPPAGRRVLASYRRVFGSEGNGYALYGYEAMSLVLSAVRRAGAQGNDRRAVIAQLLGTRGRNSVLGRYSIEPDGDTTLSRFAVDRVSGGRTVFYRVIDVPRR